MRAQRSAAPSGNGFTLIELLVVCAIMVLVSAVVLVNQNRFGGSTLLQSFAYDVALSVRQAQEYGISVQGVTCPGNTSPNFTSAFGIDFRSSENKQYILFADCKGDGMYDSNSDYTEKIFDITHNYSIQQLCVTMSGGSQTSCSKVSQLDVVFQRPEPDAKISWVDGSNGTHSCLSQGKCAETAVITLQSPAGATRDVTIENNGQISVAQNTQN